MKCIAVYLQAADSKGGEFHLFVYNPSMGNRAASFLLCTQTACCLQKNSPKGRFAFRTVPDDAALVIPGMTAFHRLLDKMINIYNVRPISPLSQIKKSQEVEIHKQMATVMGPFRKGPLDTPVDLYFRGVFREKA